MLYTLIVLLIFDVRIPNIMDQPKWTTQPTGKFEQVSLLLVVASAQEWKALLFGL